MNDPIDLNKKLHCPACGSQTVHTLEELLNEDFYLSCECGLSVFIEDGSMRK